ncbi:hypothetical protein GOP47_0005713 [Adiantum capillus-veneris]|uniref:Uncharacterized protein n=1 Tax=Adiantum capillus-veneris TaxID=13818 RepID=A0A9D4V5N5_ADICA|nr:hypothetical protein GOP47_0005713 [Adiantum capillus-veneris]
MVDVDDESQVLVDKAMARIQGMQGFPSFIVLFEGTTGEGMPVFALEDQLLQVDAMLLTDMVLKLAMQAPLCRLLQVILFEDNHAMATSLADGWETDDVKGLQGVPACFMCEEGSWVQFFEVLCCQELHTWIAYRFTSATLGWFVSVLQTDDMLKDIFLIHVEFTLCLGEPMAFHLMPVNLSLSIYYYLSSSCEYYLLVSSYAMIYYLDNATVEHQCSTRGWAMMVQLKMADLWKCKKPRHGSLQANDGGIEQVFDAIRR